MLKQIQISALPSLTLPTSANNELFENRQFSIHNANALCGDLFTAQLQQVCLRPPEDDLSTLYTLSRLKEDNDKAAAADLAVADDEDNEEDRRALRSSFRMTMG